MPSLACARLVSTWTTVDSCDIGTNLVPSQEHHPASLFINRRIIASFIRLLVVWTLLISLPLSTYADPPKGSKEDAPNSTHQEKMMISTSWSPDGAAFLDLKKPKVPRYTNRKLLPNRDEFGKKHNSPAFFWNSWNLISAHSPSEMTMLVDNGSERRRTGGMTPSSRRRGLVAANVCTNKDISIFQSPDGSSGIPQFIVQIVNTCMNECAPSNIHVFCGWFASAQLVNPNAFKRLAYNDCLVNGGRPLRHGEIVRFTYANSFMYPIRFMSANFCK